jgi:hypothetical protein
MQYALAITAYVQAAPPKLYILQYALVCRHVGCSPEAVSYVVPSSLTAYVQNAPPKLYPLQYALAVQDAPPKLYPAHL